MERARVGRGTLASSDQAIRARLANIPKDGVDAQPAGTLWIAKEATCVGGFPGI